jgi:hypothetical protein
VTAPPASFLATRRGRLPLLLGAVQFLDAVGSSIMNVALPSIRRDLGFSAPGRQCVLSGYLVTYEGLLPTEPLSAEQAVDEALTTLQEHRATTVTRGDLTAACERHRRELWSRRSKHASRRPAGALNRPQAGSGTPANL